MSEEEAKERLKNKNLYINIKPKSSICIDCINENRNKHIEAEIVINEELEEAIESVLNLLEKKDKEIQFQKDINKIEKDRHKKTEKSLKGQIIKQNKIIDLMAKKLNQAYFDGDKFETWFDKIMGVQEKMDYGYVVPLIKQYFERKIKNE